MSAPATASAWLLPDEAAAPARDAFIAATARGAFEGASYTADDRRLWIPHADSTDKEWAYWDAANLSPAIVKIQARPAPGKYESPGNDSRAVFGILDNAIFWIGHDVQPDGEYFGVGYDYLVDSRFDAPADAGRPDFLVPNVAWRGDALGLAKATGSPVWGPAVLTLMSVGTDRSDSFAYDLHLDVSFLHEGNVEQIKLATSGADGAFGSDFSADTGHRLQGIFLGSRAEEASGIFETARHFGAFGVKR